MLIIVPLKILCNHGITEGEIFDKSAELSLKAGMPEPKAVILIHIDEIYSLAPGPMAGKKIG